MCGYVLGWRRRFGYWTRVLRCVAMPDYTRKSEICKWMDGRIGLTRRSSPACIAHTTQIPYHRPRQNRRRMRRGWVYCTRRRSNAGASGALLATMRLSVPATDPQDIHACLGRYDLCRTAGRSDIGSVRDRAHGKKGANSEHRWEPSPSQTVGANFGC